MLNPTPEVRSRYGAPMGRPTRDTFTDKQGKTYKLTVAPDARPFNLVRVRLNQGGYDAGGAYWGNDEPLYYFEGPLSDISGYVRGWTREAAKKAVRAMHPHARFYR